MCVLDLSRFLFHQEKLSLATITSCKSASCPSLYYVFNIHETKIIYLDFSRATSDLRSAPLPKSLRWSLVGVLSFTIIEIFQTHLSLPDLTIVTRFLLVLAMGSKIRELQAFLRTDETILYKVRDIPYILFRTLSLKMRIPFCGGILFDYLPNSRRMAYFTHRWCLCF